jgi:hypothetical protein
VFTERVDLEWNASSEILYEKELRLKHMNAMAQNVHARCRGCVANFAQVLVKCLHMKALDSAIDELDR